MPVMSRNVALIGASLLVVAAAASGDAASSSAVRASLDAYVASVTAGSAYSALWTGIPLGIPQDLARLADNAPAVSSYETLLQPSQQSFINSIISEEQRIEQSTVDPKQYATSVSAASVSNGAVASSIDAYLSSVFTESGYSSIESEIPPKLIQQLPEFAYIAPALLIGDGGLPSDAQNFISSVISVEQEIVQTTVTTAILHHFILPFSTTTITGGTFVRPSATATPGTTQTSPVTSSATSSPSSAAAGPRYGPSRFETAQMALCMGVVAAVVAL